MILPPHGTWRGPVGTVAPWVPAAVGKGTGFWKGQQWGWCRSTDVPDALSSTRGNGEVGTFYVMRTLLEFLNH